MSFFRDVVSIYALFPGSNASLECPLYFPGIYYESRFWKRVFALAPNREYWKEHCVVENWPLRGNSGNNSAMIKRTITQLINVNESDGTTTDDEKEKAPFIKGLMHDIGLPWTVKWWSQRESNPCLRRERPAS